ncbi:hypothetical protein [Melghirimyces thermohalophilus]|uniref:hypothetical protein n=1 Tax=Melghirimyces thermohalophilus TaxID=1236220 RepID=UPI00115F8BAA|nr:hypothetical protein [Melghirimyces thermohalophilus]
MLDRCSGLRGRSSGDVGLQVVQSAVKDGVQSVGLDVAQGGHVTEVGPHGWEYRSLSSAHGLPQALK